MVPPSHGRKSWQRNSHEFITSSPQTNLTDDPAIQLPYGVRDLECHTTGFRRLSPCIRCYVRGCKRFLRVPKRGIPGEVCPDHGIVCHSSGKNSTFVYADPRRNLITSAELFARRLIGHPFKYETHRFGNERSEDALTWNVFRSFQEAGKLSEVAAWIIGQRHPWEPFLFLWGIGLTDDDFAPWPLLIEARQRFESRLPVVRPLTEPDIALWLPGKYLILIEAKFTSRNPACTPGPRGNPTSLTFRELLDIYDDRALRLPDRDRVGSSKRLYPQLWRNLVFSDWMAQADHDRTLPFLANLVCEGQETGSAAEFGGLLRPGYRKHFRRITWEDLYRLCGTDQNCARLRRYLETKTAGLRKAFAIPQQSAVHPDDSNRVA